MQGGNPNLELVTYPISTVKVNNQIRPAEAVSVTRELATDIPEAVVGSNGIAAATGQVTWAPRVAVTTGAETPWTPIGMVPPKPGDDVSIDMGMDDQEWRQLTGTVDSSSGSLAGGVASSSVVDRIDLLRKTLTLWPQLAQMPRTTPWSPETLRWSGLTALSVVDRVVRQCGFSATPRPTDDSIFSLSLLGDLHPDLGGELYTSPYTAAPAWENTEWGPAVKRDKGDITWVITDKRLGPNVGFELVMQVPKTGGTGSATVVVDGKNFLRITVTSTGVTVGYIDSTQTFRTMSHPGRAFTRVGLRFSSVDWRGTYELWKDDVMAAGPSWSLPAVSTNTAGEWRMVVGGQLPIGGVVLDPLQGAGIPRAINEQPNMVWDVDNLEPLVAFPARVREEGLNIIRQAAAALCASMWIDEYGRLRWVSRGITARRSSSISLTSRDSLLDLGWVNNSAALRRKVSVAWSQPAITASAVPGVTLWQAPEIITEHEPEFQLFVHPPSNEDWIGIDTTIKFLSGTPPISMENVEKGIGTFAYTNVLEGGYGVVYNELRQIDPQSLIFTAHNQVNPSRIGWQTLDDFPVEQYRSQPTPYLRGRGRVQWSEVSTASDNRGSVLAADYEHSASVWVQSEGQAKALADWLAMYSVNSHPRIESLSIMPDPRVQLGDVVQIKDIDVMHLELTAVVVGIHIDQNGIELNQSLTLRVISVFVPEVLLRDHDNAWRGSDLFEHDTFWTPGDLHDLDNNPLRTD